MIKMNLIIKWRNNEVDFKCCWYKIIKIIMVTFLKDYLSVWKLLEFFEIINIDWILKILRELKIYLNFKRNNKIISDWLKLEFKSDVIIVKLILIR